MNLSESSLRDDMVPVPAGRFIMGSDEFDIEGPSREVELPAYLIDRYPVTNEAYASFVASTGHRQPDDWPSGGPPADRLDHPVERVTWDDASAYATWAGKRLPTEAEWEKAARGPDGRRWPWGDTFDEANCIVWDHAPTLGVTTVPVTSYASGASPYGALHMAGNVEEWVEDEFFAYPGSSHRSAAASGGQRVLRGGSWFFTMEYARGSFRRGVPRSFTGWSSCGGPGFRCAATRPGP